MKAGNHVPWRGATYLNKGLPDRWGTAELPSQGVSGTGSDVDGDAGSFLPLESPGCRHNLEGGKPPHTQCPLCDILVPWSTLNGRHLATAQCDKGEERNRRCLVEEELRESLDRSFQAYGKPLETVTLLKYLRQIMTVGDDD